MIGAKTDKNKHEKIISLKEGIEKLVKQIQKEDMQKIKNDFSMKLKEHQEGVKDIKNDMDFLKESVKDLAAFQESMKKFKITTLEQNIQRGTLKKLKELSENIEEMKENKEKIESLEDDVIKLKNDHANFKKLVQQFKGFDKLKGELENISRANESIESLKNKFKDVEEKFNLVETRMHSMEKNIFTEIDLMKRESGKLKNNEQLRRNIKILRGELESIKKRISEDKETKEKIESLEDEIIKIRNDQESLKEESIDKFKKKLEKVSEISKSIDDFKDKLNEIESNFASLKTEVHNVEKNFFTELDLMKRESGELKSSVVEVKKDLHEDKFEKDLEILRGELESIKKRISEDKSIEIAALNEKMKKIEEEIKSIKLSAPVVIE